MREYKYTVHVCVSTLDCVRVCVSTDVCVYVLYKYTVCEYGCVYVSTDTLCVYEWVQITHCASMREYK